MAERRFHVAYREYFVGGFLILATLTLIAMLLATLSKKDLFQDTYHLKTVFTSKSDMSVGAAIKIRGMKVGEVTDLGFNDDNKIELTLEIQSKYQRMIRSNSIATLIQERFPISDRIINISLGDPKLPLLEDGMFIKADEGPDLDLVIKKALKTFDEITQMVDRISHGQGTVGAVLNREDLYNNILAASQQGVTILKSSNQLITQVNQIAVKADNLIDTLKPMLNSTNTALRDVPELLQKVKTLLDSATFLLSNVNAAATNLPEVVDQGQKLMGNADELMGAVKNTWPISTKLATEVNDPPLFIEEK
jgi:phospholipid/cholesterol/gamma-HCH transport system substrate-binding protein